ncbi:MAG: hypothetical protein Q4C86_12010 [bacterium]|nr:hypothetical protein [bacterium]
MKGRSIAGLPDSGIFSFFTAFAKSERIFRANEKRRRPTLGLFNVFCQIGLINNKYAIIPTTFLKI